VTLGFGLQATPPVLSPPGPFAPSRLRGTAAGPQPVSRLRRALPGAAILLRVGEAEARMIEHTNRHPHGAFVGLRNEISFGEKVDNLCANGLTHLLVVT